MATPLVATAHGRSLAAPRATPVPIPGSMPPLPPPTGAAAASLEASTGSSASVGAPGPGPATAFGILATSETTLQDASSGPHRDGRIRNPVPSKLKGKTDGSKGNFSVMHMEVAGRSEATDRDAEAKRTSESTELAAKRAFENGYVSLRRSRFIHLPDEPVAKPFVPTPSPAPAPTRSQHGSPLGPQETKSEQARLLTLLRSLHPVLVVDQICKALAFFGGIPGAPPPANDGFPESAEANGPGSLFVGWIAEIFPKLGGNNIQQSLDPARQLDAPQAVRRKRGRPKGSKATKARKDKGIKKGPSKPHLRTDQVQPSDAPDDSWVDVDDNLIPATDDVDANIMLLAHATSPQPQGDIPHSSMVSGTPSQAPSVSARTALPGAPTASGAAADVTSSARKRGRPKGSRNRPKELVASSAETVTEMSQGVTRLSQEHHPNAQSPQIPQITQAPQVMDGSVAHQSFTAVNISASTKKKDGRPKGSGPNQLAQRQHSQLSSGSERQGAVRPSGLTNPAVPAQAHPQTYQAPQAIQDSQDQTWTPPTASPAQAKPATTAAQKRKRKADRDAPLSRSNDQENRPALSSEVNGPILATPPNNSRPAPPLAAAPEPPPKRSRKGKEPKLPARKANERVAKPIRGTLGTAPPELPSPKSAPNPTPKAGPTSPPTAGTRLQSTLVSTSVVEHPMGSMHSPQQSHFEVQSPTMENYEAQLQAQLEQQTEVEPQALASQSGPDSTQLIPSRLPRQPQQQQQQKYTQQHHHHQQQVQQKRQQQQQQHAPVGHGRSPNLQPQSAESQAASSPLITQQARPSQTHFNQYRASTSQYQQHQPPQQNYVSSQPEQSQHHQQQFSGQQQAQSAQVSSARQYSTGTSQPPQYSSNQQTYGPSQQQYSGGQQQLGSQQRYQHQLATTSAGTTSYTTHQSPQFSASASNTFSNTTDGNYRSPVASLNSTSYGQRSQSVTPSAANFRAASTHGLPQHSPPFGTGAATLQQRSASTSQPTTQSMQGLAGVQNFTGGGPGAEWGLFDTSHLTDASGQQATMALNNANYGINTATVRASSNNNSAFAAAAGLATYDASSLGGSDRYYGVARR